MKIITHIEPNKLENLSQTYVDMIVPNCIIIHKPSSAQKYRNFHKNVILVSMTNVGHAFCGTSTNRIIVEHGIELSKQMMEALIPILKVDGELHIFKEIDVNI